MNSEIIKSKINDIYNQLVDIRNEFHMYPELSENEVLTAERIAGYLDSWSIPYEKNVVGHGIIATVAGELPGKVVAIRADMDALPIHEAVESDHKSRNDGIMHACGHDIHMTMLLGTAYILNTMKDEFPGTLKLLFEPAEETIGGAERLIKYGCLENPHVDAVMGIHVEPRRKVGQIELKHGVTNATSTEFYVTVIGASCHGAAPHNGTDALVVACNTVMALQTVVSRSVSPVKSAVVTVGQLHAGTVGNVIAGEAKFSGIIRALDMKSKENIKKQIRLLVENTARAHGARAEVIYIDSYPVLENNNDMVDTIIGIAGKELGNENVLIMPSPSMGADDFAYFCHASKGLYFNIGTLPVESTERQAVHSEHFNPDPQCMKTGILLEVLGTLAFAAEDK